MPEATAKVYPLQISFEEAVEIEFRMRLAVDRAQSPEEALLIRGLADKAAQASTFLDAAPEEPAPSFFKRFINKRWFDDGSIDQG